MENLYSKLYDKYSTLKSKMESEIDRNTPDQEVKFLDFSTAAGELIDFFRSENSRLQTQINELTEEVALTRYDEEEEEEEKLLLESAQRLYELACSINIDAKELSEKVLRVGQQLQLECSAMNGKDGQLDSPGCTCSYTRRRDMPNESSRKRPSIERVADQTDEAGANPFKDGHTVHAMRTESEGDSCRDMLSDRDGNFQQDIHSV